MAAKPQKANGKLQRARAAWAQVRAKRGEVSRIARAIGIRPQAVHKWKVVPVERVFDVERLTGRRPETLRPDKALFRDLAKARQQLRNLARRRPKSGRRKENCQGEVEIGDDE